MCCVGCGESISQLGFRIWAMNYRNWLVSIFVIWVWGSLQVIPVQWAPVIPDPVYSRTLLSMWRIAKISLFPFPGIQYQFNIYTFIVIAILIGTGFLARYLLLKYLPKFKENSNGQDQES